MRERFHLSQNHSDHFCHERLLAHETVLMFSSWILIPQTKLHSSAPRSSEAEETIEVLEDENRALKSQLDEAKRGATRLSKERDELTQRLEERDLEREVLKRGKSDLEEQKRLLDRALEKINKEVCARFSPPSRAVITVTTVSPLASDGDDDGGLPAVGGRPAVAARRLQGAFEEGPSRGPAQ